MKLKKSFEQNYIETATFQNRVAKAENKMRFKTFTERFAPLQVISEAGKFIFPAFSILLAITFISGFVSTYVNEYLAYVIALILLLLIELIKNQTVSNGFELHYGNQGKTIGLFVVATAISTLSVIFSYNGAEKLVQALETKTQTVKKTDSNQRDSLNTRYESLIAADLSAISTIKDKAKRQWKGLNTPEQNRQINQLLENVNQLRAEKQANLSELKEATGKKLQQTEKEVFYSVYWSKILALIIEVLILVSVWFTVFYDYKTVQQKELLIEAGHFELPENTKTKKESHLKQAVNYSNPSLNHTRVNGFGNYSSDDKTNQIISEKSNESETQFSETSARVPTRVPTRVLDYDKIYIVNEAKNILGTPVTGAKISNYGKNRLMREIISKYPDKYTSAGTFYGVFELMEQMEYQV